MIHLRQSMNSRAQSSTARCPKLPFGRRSRPGGYTLIEVLVATMLTGVLLATLWGIFTVYQRLFERGEQLAGTAQLRQTWYEQLKRDLDIVAFMSAPPAIRQPVEAWRDPIATPSSDPFDYPDDFERQWLADRVLPADSPLLAGDPQPPLPTIGLLGGPHSLRIVGPRMQPDFASSINAPSTQADVTTNQSVDSQELRIIEYRWVGGQADETAAEPTEATAHGLMRVEQSWAQYLSRSASGQQRDAYSPGAPGADWPEQEHDFDYQLNPLTPGDERPVLPGGNFRVDLLENVQGIRFRYFDGTSWRNSWDSGFHGHIPVAIEVFIQFSHRSTSREGVQITPDAQGIEGIDDAYGFQQPGEIPFEQLDETQLRELSRDSASTGVFRYLLAWTSHVTASSSESESSGIPGVGAAAPGPGKWGGLP